MINYFHVCPLSTLKFETSGLHETANWIAKCGKPPPPPVFSQAPIQLFDSSFELSYQTAQKQILISFAEDVHMDSDSFWFWMVRTAVKVSTELTHPYRNAVTN